MTYVPPMNFPTGRPCVEVRIDPGFPYGITLKPLNLMPSMGFTTGSVTQLYTLEEAAKVLAAASSPTPSLSPLDPCPHCGAQGKCAEPLKCLAASTKKARRWQVEEPTVEEEPIPLDVGSEFADRVLHEYVTICIDEHGEDATSDHRVEAMRRVLNKAWVTLTLGKEKELEKRLQTLTDELTHKTIHCLGQARLVILRMAKDSLHTSNGPLPNDVLSVAKDDSALRTAAIDLSAKLKEITASEDYKGVFGVAFVHGYKYNGPNYENELKALDYVLDTHPPQ